MQAPPGIAKLDSATAMLQALSRCVDGKDFAGLGQPWLLRSLMRSGDWLPRPWRERAFVRLGTMAAVAPEQIQRVRTAAVAAWLVERYPRRRYPAVMIGSANGAVVHLAAAAGVPWLPQTLLTLVRQADVHPDDPLRAMEVERRVAARFLAANPDTQLHQLHDPCRDRLLLSRVACYRAKFRRLPPGYRDFLGRALEPGGTVYVVECGQRWPTTRLGERHVFQFGAVGGATVREYFEGGERVADYLARRDSPVRRWSPPQPDGECCEAEWGFAPALLHDVLGFARAHRLRVVQLLFDHPEDPSALVAELYRRRLAGAEKGGGRLAVDSFIVIEPYWVLRTGAVPYWMVGNTQPSLDRLHAYLSGTTPYERIYLTLFPHGVDSVGVPPIGAWRDVFARARREGGFLGMDPDAYPAHFGVFGGYSHAVRDLAPHRRMPDFLPLERAEAFVAGVGRQHGVRLEVVS